MLHTITKRLKICIVISSCIYKVISLLLNFFFFFLMIRLYKHQKAAKGTKKHQKAPKSTNQFKIYRLKIHRHKFIKFDISLSSLNNI